MHNPWHMHQFDQLKEKVERLKLKSIANKRTIRDIKVVGDRAFNLKAIVWASLAWSSDISSGLAWTSSVTSLPIQIRITSSLVMTSWKKNQILKPFSILNFHKYGLPVSGGLLLQAKQRGKIAKTVKMAKSFKSVILATILTRLMTDNEATRQNEKKILRLKGAVQKIQVKLVLWEMFHLSNFPQHVI